MGWSPLYSPLFVEHSEFLPSWTAIALFMELRAFRNEVSKRVSVCVYVAMYVHPMNQCLETKQLGAGLGTCKWDDRIRALK